MKRFLTFLFFIFIPSVGGYVGSLFTVPALVVWYFNLNKPWFSPPNWVFAPVWTILYILMGIASYLVYDSNGENKNALTLYFVQLPLNLFWSVLFFRLKNPLLGFFDILILDTVVFFATIRFYKISKTAGHMFMLYLIWLSYATILNVAIVLLN